MRKCILVIAAIIFAASTAYAQVEVGLGLGAPLTAANIPTEAHLDGSGIVHVDKTLDASPQIMVEVHRVFKMNEKYGVGPFIGFAPKIDFGLATNNQTEQPIGAGFGMLTSIHAGQKYRLNVGLMWLITGAVKQVDPAWQDGFQAPRNRQDLPMDVGHVTKSTNRILLTMTVSGLF